MFLLKTNLVAQPTGLASGHDAASRRLRPQAFVHGPVVGARGYDGGEVLLYNTLSDSITLSRALGSISFFPSYTIHEVLPVTRGTRYSLVGWVYGPAFV